MAAKVQMSWKGLDKLQEQVNGVDLKVKRVVTGVFLYHKPIAESYAKQNAPWTDRTGNARSGLFAEVDLGPQGNPTWWELIVAHSVYYGIFLEVCNSGRYAILDKTTKAVGNMILERLQNALTELEAANR